MVSRSRDFWSSSALSPRSLALAFSAKRGLRSRNLVLTYPIARTRRRRRCSSIRVRGLEADEPVEPGIVGDLLVVLAAIDVILGAFHLFDAVGGVE
jgi:hypothetical protein